ncbi:MAG: MFS transporter [Bradyrhizobium sp.]|nr:MFS transporter [Bradyrhizobium sp.]
MSEPLQATASAQRRRSPLPFAIILTTFYMAASAPTPLYRFYQETFGISPMIITLVFSVYAFALLKALLFAGSISDHIGRKPVIISSLLIELVAMALFSYADGTFILITARVIQGIATGIAAASVGAALVDTDPTRGPVINSIVPLIGMGLGAIGASLLVQFGPHRFSLVYDLLLVAFAVEAVLLLALSETGGKKPGAWASLKPRLAVPPQAMDAFVLITSVNVATWTLGGFYLSIVPSLVAVTTGNRTPVVSGSVVAALLLVGAAAVLTRRLKEPMTNLYVGVVFTATGVLTVAAGVHLGAVPVILAGTVVSGIGVGTSFLGSTRHLIPLAKSDERAGLFSAFYIQTYLALSLPVIVAGYLIRQIGYVQTTDIFTAAIVALSIIGFMAISREKTRAQNEAIAKETT